MVLFCGSMDCSTGGCYSDSSGEHWLVWNPRIVSGFIIIIIDDRGILPKTLNALEELADFI